MDAMYGVGLYPYRGLALTLVAFKWDDISSSEAAVYRATVEAMQIIRARARWEFVDGRQRTYA